jgi:hypothetical protein
MPAAAEEVPIREPSQGYQLRVWVPEIQIPVASDRGRLTIHRSRGHADHAGRNAIW